MTIYYEGASIQESVITHIGSNGETPFSPETFSPVTFYPVTFSP